MRYALSLVAPFLLASVTLAAEFEEFAADPRNTADYGVLFDLEAKGKSDLVNGYGAYVQIHARGATHFVRYCDNFDGGGMSGRPNPNRIRKKLLPLGSTDGSAFKCRDYTPEEIAQGQALIQMGSRSFFAMKSSRWTLKDGGEILFQFARKIPLVGAPTYKTIRIRATRSTSALDYVVETVVPRSGNFATANFLFDVSGSGLGIPNGIDAVTIDPNSPTEKKIDLDSLEGPTQILGKAKRKPTNPTPTRPRD